MQKIRIISNYPVKQPQCLENIDVSLGVSYFCSQDKTVKTLENKWGFKTLLKLVKITDIVTSDIFSNKDIVEQILEDSHFISKHQPENAANLHVQINHNNIAAKVVNYLAAFNILKTLTLKNKQYNKSTLSTLDDVFSGTSSQAGSIFSDDKKMFLGTSFFEKSNNLYKYLCSYFSKKQAVSFIFFHEFSHASELENNAKYGKENIKTNTSLDNFYSNLLLLHDSKRFIKLCKQFYNERKINYFPNKLLVDTLYVLHKEIYADVGSLLLMRNKSLLENNYDEEKFFQSVETVTQMRKEEKEQYAILFNINHESSFIGQEHFTSPGVEVLANYLKNIPSQEVLSEKQIHEITCECVQQGIAKTILTMIKADNSLVPKFSTLFSLKLNNNDLVMDNSKNHYLECIQTIKNIVSVEWQNNFEHNLALIEKNNARQKVNVSQDLIFNAGLDQDNFNKVINTFSHNIVEDKNKIKHAVSILREKFLNNTSSNNLSVNKIKT